MVQITTDHLAADHIASAGGGAEPQRPNNFTIRFGRFLSAAALYVSGISFPQLTATVEELRVGNFMYKYATAVSFGDINITLYDVISGEVSRSLNSWFENVVSFQSGAINLPSQYKDDATLSWIDGCGGTQRSWLLVDCFPRDINFGQGNMQGGGPVEVQVTLAVDLIASA